MTQSHRGHFSDRVKMATITTEDDRRGALIEVIHSNAHVHDARVSALACAARTVVTNLLVDILSAGQSATDEGKLAYYTAVAESLIAEWPLNVRLVRWAGEACAMLEKLDSGEAIDPSVLVALSANVYGDVTSTDHCE